MSWTRMLSY